MLTAKLISILYCVKMLRYTLYYIITLYNNYHNTLMRHYYRQVSRFPSDIISSAVVCADHNYLVLFNHIPSSAASLALHFPSSLGQLRAREAEEDHG